MNRLIDPIEEIEPIKPTPKRSGRVCRLTEFYQSGMDYANYIDVGEPSSYKEAIATPDANTWLQAMKYEMYLIHQNQTWELIELLVGRKSLPCKWVFRQKYVFDLENPKYKA